MKHQQQNNKWSCLPTAFAMCMDIDVDELIKMIGHDGSEIVWPQYPDPYCRRSFHPQEIFYAAITLAYSIMEIQEQPIMSPFTGAEPFKIDCGKMPMNLMCCRVVLIGNNPGRYNHAIAYDPATQRNYDPSQSEPIENLKDFKWHTCYAVSKIK